MFKKTNYNQTSIEVLKKTALIFDINANPPTANDINERIRSFPEQEYLTQEIKKEKLTKEITLGWLSFIAFSGIFGLISGELIPSMVISIAPAAGIGVVFSSEMKSEKAELARLVAYEKKMLSEISKSHEEEMLNFCKSSAVCMNYKNKVIAEKRPLLLAEYVLFKEQIRKEKEEAINKELYGMAKEQEKENYSSYSL